MRVLLLLLAAAFTCSCSPATPVSHLEGTWSVGFEENRFREPGRQYEQGWGWCIDEASPVWNDLFTDVDREFTMVELRVEIEGIVSGPSEVGLGYGHMGLCDRQISVTKVIHAEVIELTPPPMSD